MSLLAYLNEPQREAVIHHKGPLLVLAGAGSGKTRVITYRIAYLMQEKQLPAHSILAMTFTNKAAAEMKERVSELVEDSSELPLVSTFHSFCLRLLRSHIHLLDYPNSFTIYDTDDQTALLRRICKELAYDEMTPRGIQSRISAAKNSKLGPLTYLESGFNNDLVEIYHRYQAGLKQAGAVDFDDMLLLTNDLFTARPDLLNRYQQQYTQLLVDEFQDTNAPQFELVKKLAAPQNNVCVVGDDDQSIYKWRGADVQNILNFSRDFEGTRVVKLEQNYRSTQNILDAAHGIVKDMLGRHQKKLWTDKGAGAPLQLFQGDDEGSEASFIVMTINDLKKSNKLSDCAVLFRTNSQSRALEDALNRHKLPYQLVGGTRFYDRKEVKDILAYIQVVLNPADRVNLRRIINNPTRGIGDVSLSRIEAAADKHDTSILDIIENKLQFTELTPAQRKSVRAFADIVQSIREEVEKNGAASGVIEHVVHESGYYANLIKEGTDEAHGRLENIRELVTSAKTFEASTSGEYDIKAFLDQVSLVSDVDTYDTSVSGKVTLMTLHSAKGLEFPFVFLAGWEEGLLPHARNIEEPDLLEEERRLCYVGITRAQKKLFLTCSRMRRTYEGHKINRPSRFLDDIPATVIQEKGRGSLLQKRKTSVGSNIDNISKFFKDRNINIDTSRLNKHAAKSGGAEFRRGDKVFLPKYGDGTIMGTEGEGDNLRYLVYFSSIGQRKKIVARLGTLQKR